MQKDDYKTVVVFRVWNESWKKNKSVIALFPNVDWTLTLTRGLCASYEHVGQHGAADYDVVIRRTRAATPEEYKDLKEELESIGYDLDVRKRRPIKR